MFRPRPPSAPVTALCLLNLLSVFGCGDSELTPEQSLEKSCNGEIIVNCRPYEYAIVREATVMPTEVEVGDPLARIDVRVVYDGCADAPSTHIISLRGIDESGGDTSDGGTPGSVFPLTTLRDGSSDDMDDAPGVIATSVANFFIAPVPARAELVIQVEPRIDVCRGESVHVPYRTGATFEMP
ncbi:MAG: hypothetical protein JRH11_11435 [Deltaproteobacteria bacterium]|nr:hypothetical protein [Deltaproteobacteria bacterium]